MPRNSFLALVYQGRARITIKDFFSLLQHRRARKLRDKIFQAALCVAKWLPGSGTGQLRMRVLLGSAMTGRTPDFFWGGPQKSPRSVGSVARPSVRTARPPHPRPNGTNFVLIKKGPF